jgi:hypothetical protein
MNSHNIAEIAGPSNASKVFTKSLWADGNIFWDVNAAFRIGAEFSWYKQTYADGVDATNIRGQGSFFYLF